MQISQQFPRIDLGQTGWVMPSAPGWFFGTEQRAKDFAATEKLSPDGLHHSDTRPTMRTVMEHIRRMENDALKVPEDSRKWTTGPWDEYFSHGCGSSAIQAPDVPWPEGYRWISAYVVTGGSEGLYLHVDAIFQNNGGETRSNLFIGKTCSSNHEAWEACYASAARIAWYLQA